jgi:hypothetical protein
LRFAVRRPATRPASPRGHRPPGGDVPALRAGSSRRPAARDDFAEASPAERTDASGGRGLTPPGRAALARVLMGPAGADLDLSPSTGRPQDPRPAVGTAPRLPALAGVPAGTADGPWTRDGPARGPAAGPYASAAAGTTELDLTAPGGHTSAAAGEDPEVLTPTRVMAGRPAACPGETVDRLGTTTDTLLLRHVLTRPVKDVPGPTGRLGLNRPARPPMPGAPSTTTEIPRRERRPLTGRKAGASTPRTR